MLFPKKIEIYSLTLKKLHTLDTKSRFNALEFADIPGQDGEEGKEILCVGTEKGVVEVFEVEVGSGSDDEVGQGEGQEVEGETDEKDDKGSGADVTKIGELIGHSNR